MSASDVRPHADTGDTGFPAPMTAPTPDFRHCVVNARGLGDVAREGRIRAVVGTNFPVFPKFSG